MNQTRVLTGKWGKAARTMPCAALLLILTSPLAQADASQSLVNEKGVPRLFAEPERMRPNQVSAGRPVSYFEQSAQSRSVRQAIFPSQGEPNDRFGASLDRSGNTLVVGGWGAFGGEGSAYVSSLNQGNWGTPVALAAPTFSGDNFGWSVATDGTSIAVGARGASEPDDISEPLLETGALTFFGRSNQGWVPTQRLYSSGRDEGSAFAFSLDMQDGVALVGEPGADDVVRGLSESGAAYIFSRNGAGQWSETQRLEAPDAADDDVLGLSVALSKVGDRSFAFVAALGSDDRGSASGAVYVFERSRAGTDFVYRQKLLALDGGADDQFGFSLSAKEGRLVVGAPGFDLPNAVDAGAVYVFELGAGGWSQRAKVLAGGGQRHDRFGYQVSLGDTGFAVSRFPDPRLGTTSRRVSVYQRVSSSAYQIQGALTAPDVQGKESFGGALNYEQGTLLVGIEAARNPNGAASGSVEVFEIAALPAPLLGFASLGGLGLGLLALRRKRG